jgi:replicative DNA helicase
MRNFSLQAEFVDPAAEREVLAAILKAPSLFHELSELLPEGVFVQELEKWRQAIQAIQLDQKLEIPVGWNPAADPVKAAHHLQELFHRRAIASTLEKAVQSLYNPGISPSDVATELAAGAAQAQRSVQTTHDGQLLSAVDVLAEVLDDAENRQKERQSGERTVAGLRMGIQRLDGILNGLNDGLGILAGGPGIGKTTLAVRISDEIAGKVPVVYVTFENSPKNLVLKAICARAGINTRDVEAGTADLEKLTAAAMSWACDVAPRLAFVQGSSLFSVPELRRGALQMKTRTKSARSPDCCGLFAALGEGRFCLRSSSDHTRACGSSRYGIARPVNGAHISYSSYFLPESRTGRLWRWLRQDLIRLTEGIR